MIEPDDLQKLIDEELTRVEAGTPVKTIDELAREFSHIPGIRMLAAMAAAARQEYAETVQYVNPNSVHLPTGRPRERSVL